MNALEAIAGAALHALVQMAAVLAVSALIGNRLGHHPAEGWELLIMAAASVGLIGLLVTGIVRPYALTLLRGGKAPSTSRAHYVTDALFLAHGVYLTQLALGDRQSPGFDGLISWGMAHVVIALGLILLRLSWRPR